VRISRTDFLRILLPGVVAAACLLGSTGCKPAEDGGGTAGGGSSASASGDEIKVGVYVSLTGDTSTFGTQSRDGIQFAVDELNAAGGVLGKKIVLDIQDDQSRPDEAKTVATKFASDPKIVAVIGEVASTLSKNAAPVLQRAQIPMISPSSTNPDVTKIGDYIFRVCFIDPFQGYVMAKFARENLKLSNVAVMRDQANDYSVGLADVFKREFQKMGGKITADVSYSAKDSDFRSQLTQVKGADAIFIPGYYGEVGTIARQAREQGINVPLLGGDGWDSDKLVAGAGGPGKALEGCYFSTHYSKDAKEPRVQEFVRAYTEKKGVPPASLVAQGYDAMMILADAIKRAGGADRAKVRDALAQTKNYPAVTGDITIDEQRNATKSAVVLQVKGDEFQFVTTVSPTGGGDAAAGESAATTAKAE
jgi:ABC-type branched-chain amino acid transport systems, periplasmic component